MKKNNFNHQDIEDVRINDNESVYEMEDFSVDDIQNMIDNLPNGYKMVFNLYAIEGYKHQEIAELIQKLEIQNTIIIGSGAKSIYDFLSNNGYKGKLHFVENVEKGISKAKEMIQLSDVVLVKASRSIGLERVANAIVSDFSENLTNTNNQEVGP